MLVAVSADAASLTVTSTADAGGTCPGTDCSLRQAIVTAISGDTINFSLPANSAITLTSGELAITKNLTISGPGANLLSVQRSGAGGTPNFHIFNINNVTVTIAGLTIANGSDNLGGGIYNQNHAILTVMGCAISGNSARFGGGIYNTGGSLTITGSTVSGNSATGDGFFGGGGIYSDSVMTITNSTISGNSCGANNGGGIFSNDSSATITNSTISGNSAGSAGGIKEGGSNPTNVRNTIIAKNTATTSPDFAGPLNSQGYNLIGNTSGTTITGTTTGNQLNVDPLLETDSSGNPLLKDNGGPTKTIALLSGSTAIEGGNSSGSNTDQRGFARPVDDPGIANATGGDGSDIGAYEVQADLLPGCKNINRIVKNNNDSGTDSLRAVIANVCAGSTVTFAPNVTGAINLTSGELAFNKSLTINGPGANLLSVQRSAAAGNFRIFNIAPASVIATISGLTIANGNTAGTGAGGGGISNTGRLTLTYSTISGNNGSSGSFGGGGILNNGGTVTITNSAISGNTVSSSFGGGGILNTGGTMTITNNTISGNSADYGGGLYNFFTGIVNVTNSTISGNSANNGGGIFNNSGGGTVRARNTIIALNTSASGPDVNGALTSQGFNLIGNSAGATIAPAQFSDQIGTAGSPIDPLLGPLQDNGGPTFTRALLSGSTAIDKGESSGSATDQRGFTRPVGIASVSGGDGSDIGAFEFGSLPLRVISITRSGSDIVIDFAQAIAGRTYRLERKLALTDSTWQSISGVSDLTAVSNGPAQITDPGAVSLGKAFYRVRLLP